MNLLYSCAIQNLRISLGKVLALRYAEATPAFLNAFNQAIAQVRADGTFKKINDRYFDFDIYGN